MSRSAKKGPFVTEKLFKKVVRLNEARSKQPIKTWARACTIIPEFVGHTFEVHNGNKFIKVFVQEDMVGHKLGEFSPTRIFRGHSGKKAAAAAAGAPGAAAAPAAGSGKS
jgi:small subunit ribosomal protein S19